MIDLNKIVKVAQKNESSHSVEKNNFFQIIYLIIGVRLQTIITLIDGNHQFW